MSFFLKIREIEAADFRPNQSFLTHISNFCFLCVMSKFSCISNLRFFFTRLSGCFRSVILKFDLWFRFPNFQIELFISGVFGFGQDFDNFFVTNLSKYWAISLKQRSHVKGLVSEWHQIVPIIFFVMRTVQKRLGKNATLVKQKYIHFTSKSKSELSKEQCKKNFDQFLMKNLFFC